MVQRKLNNFLPPILDCLCIPSPFRVEKITQLILRLERSFAKKINNLQSLARCQVVSPSALSQPPVRALPLRPSAVCVNPVFSLSSCIFTLGASTSLAVGDFADYPHIPTAASSFPRYVLRIPRRHRP